MTLLWVGLAIVFLAAVAARLVTTVRSDGYGSNPPPQSHEAWNIGGIDALRRIGY